MQKHIYFRLTFPSSLRANPHNFHDVLEPLHMLMYIPECHLAQIWVSGRSPLIFLGINKYFTFSLQPCLAVQTGLCVMYGPSYIVRKHLSQLLSAFLYLKYPADCEVLVSIHTF